MSLREKTCKDNGYKYLYTIATGPNSTVNGYLKDGKHYAIKHLKRMFVMEQNLAEINFLSQVDHPNISKFVELLVDEKEIHLVMETEFVLKKCMSAAIYDEVKCRKWILDVLSGLQCLHSLGFSHNDIKPDNILVSSHFDRAILIDFGLIYPNELSVPISASIHYRSPEYLALDFKIQKTMKKPMVLSGKWADLWSLGCLISYMTSKEHLFVDIRPYMHDFEDWVVNEVNKFLKAPDVYLDNKLISYQWVGLVKQLLQEEPTYRLNLLDREAFEKSHYKEYFSPKSKEDTYEYHYVEPVVQEFMPKDTPIEKDESILQIINQLSEEIPSTHIGKILMTYTRWKSMKTLEESDQLFAFAIVVLCFRCINMNYDIEQLITITSLKGEDIPRVYNIIGRILIHSGGRMYPITCQEKWLQKEEKVME